MSCKGCVSLSLVFTAVDLDSDETKASLSSGESSGAVGSFAGAVL